METFLEIMRLYGVGGVAFAVAMITLWRLDVHVRADKVLHAQLLKGQSDLSDQVEAVRTEVQNRADRESDKRGVIHSDIDDLGQRVARLEGATPPKKRRDRE